MAGPWAPPSKATPPGLRFAGGFATGVVVVLFAAAGLSLLLFISAGVVIVVMAHPVLLPIPVAVVLGPPLYLLLVGRRDRNAFLLGIGCGTLASEGILSFLVWWSFQG